MFEEQLTKAAKIISAKNEYYLEAKAHCSPLSLDVYAWPQTTSGTNPFGAGGNMISKVTIIGCMEELTGSGVIFCGDKACYLETFKVFTRFPGI